MKKSAIIFSLALLTSFGALAQEGFKGEHFIEVTGTAKQEIEPNEIYLTVRLQEFEENKVKVTLEKLDKDFLDAVKSAGIDKSKLELANAGSQIGKIGKKDKDAFREKTYQVKLVSGTELEKFLSKIEPVKVTQVMITKLSHTDIQKITMELKIKALQAARSKAEALVKSIGSELGKPLMIREYDHQPYAGINMTANVMMRQKSEYGDADIDEDPTAFRKITLQAQVSAQFEIK